VGFCDKPPRKALAIAVKPNAHLPNQLSLSHQLQIKAAEYWLIKYLDGRLELKSGSTGNQREAHE
jgi:hypothetical protein